MKRLIKLLAILVIGIAATGCSTTRNATADYPSAYDTSAGSCPSCH